jgi:enoyl-CoA hydratase
MNVMTTAQSDREEYLADRSLHLRISTITWITIERPERLNAVDSQLLTSLANAISDLEKEPDVRVVVITGSGQRAFVAGADLSEIAKITDHSTAETLSRQGQAALGRIATSRLPTIAAVNGLALGGGCELAIACDLRVAARGAHFGMPEVTLGLIPGFGGTQRLPRLIGRGGALRMILGGDMIDAEEALRYGLVEEVVDDEHLTEAVTRLAERIAKHPPAAVSAAKSAVRKGATMSIAEGLVGEAQRFAERVISQESRDAVAAFFASRRSSR